MDAQQGVNTHYAILIGIDAYPNRPLNSCVRDVKNIQECLESKLLSVDIQTLVASRDDASLKHLDTWPTCRNVVATFEAVTFRAQPGNFIYIHYSGHGTRLDPCHELSNQSTGDLALVLLDEDGSKERNLPAPRLAALLQPMVKKGLIITVVLDCCFSASVYRYHIHDSHLRYFPWSHFGSLAHPLISEYNYTPGHTRSANRDASMRDNWILNPDRYTILAACGPHENAKGGSVTGESGEPYGALSYFLCKALSEYGLGRQLKDIHRHILNNFREGHQLQNPVLYGNKNQAFFDQMDHNHVVRATSIFDRKGSLRLLVGQAHGIRVGDCFALSPIGSAGGSTTKKNLVAKVARLWSLSSELEVASPLSRSLGDWVAEPITCLYLMKFPIRLASELSHRHEWQEMLEKLSLTICIGKDQVPAFQVVLRNDMYQILDDHGQDVINLPMMPQGATDIGRVCEILEHLTRYRMVKDMTNEVPPAALENSIDIQIKANGNVFHSDEQIEVRHDSVIQLVIKNMGQHTAYIHVYNLGPLWQVKGILYASYEVIPERSRDSGFTGITSKKIRMTVPPAMNECGSCNDVVKVFVTSQPTSFDWFELPSLDELGKTTIQNRTNRPDYDEAEAWVALNFPIRTTLEKCSYPSGSSMR